MMQVCPDYYYEQSAVVPVRRQGEGWEVLLITSRRGKRWIVPKGVIEPDLSPADSAAKEALEEAGVLGEVLPERLGIFEYEKWGGTCDVQVFVMRVTEEQEVWPEDFRRREWVTLEEAQERIGPPSLCALLHGLSDHLERYG